MAKYPIKLRIRQRRGSFRIEKLAQLSGGSWVLKDFRVVPSISVKDPAELSAVVDELLADVYVG